MRVCGKSLKMTQVGSPNPLSGGAVVFLVVGGSTQPISKPLFPLPASSPLPPIPAPGNNIGGVILDTTSCKQQPLPPSVRRSGLYRLQKKTRSDWSVDGPTKLWRELPPVLVQRLSSQKKINPSFFLCFIPTTAYQISSTPLF